MLVVAPGEGAGEGAPGREEGGAMLLHDTVGMARLSGGTRGGKRSAARQLV